MLQREHKREQKLKIKLLNSIIILIALLFSCKNSFIKVENKKCSIDIIWEEIHVNFVNKQLFSRDTLMINDEYLVSILKDCKGAGSFILYDKNYRKIKSGEYSNSLDLLKKINSAENWDTGEQTISLKLYYQAVQNGTWLEFDTLGNIKSEYLWYNGNSYQ